MLEEKATKHTTRIDGNQDLVDVRQKSLDQINHKKDQGFEWLNKESRQFLEAGYLTENVTPEERIWEVAQTAERILGMDGFAKKFYHYMSVGFYSLASPVWSNFGKERGLPISCFGSHIGDDIGTVSYTHLRAHETQ